MPSLFQLIVLLIVVLLAPALSGCSIYQSGLYGYIDKSGLFVIKPQYKTVREFSEGLAAVGFAVDPIIVKAQIAAHKIPSLYKWGYIDKTGKLLIPPKFDYARSFHGDRACVCVGRKLGYIDRAGKYIIEPKYDMPPGSGEGPSNVVDFKDGIAVIYVGGKDIGGGLLQDSKCGYIDLSGSVVIQPIFQSAGKFCEGLAAVLPVNDQAVKNQYGQLPRALYGYINKQGSYQIPPQFEQGGPFCDGLARVIIQRGKTGFIDKSGKLVIGPHEKWMARDFSEGRAAITIENGFDNDHWQTGFIDTTGKFTIQPLPYICDRFSEGMAVICERPAGFAFPKWGYMNTTGKIVIPPKYSGQEWYQFSEGLAAVPSGWFRPDGWLNQYWGFIDKTGKTVIEPKFELPNIFTEEGVGVFHEGLAAVRY